jgi:hypothetical protein
MPVLVAGAAPISPERQTPEYLAAFVAREIEKWAGPSGPAASGD